MNVLTHFVLWRLGLAAPWTYYTDEECEALTLHATGKRRLVEIGCWQGVNTARLRRAMAEDGILHAVDPYSAGRLGFSAPRIIAQRQVNAVARGSVRWMRMTDLEAARTLKQEQAPPFDFIFSDSLNTYEGFRDTWEAWHPLLAGDGIYVLANSQSTARKPIEGAGSVQFTRDVVLTSPAFSLVSIVGSFTILRKRC